MTREQYDDIAKCIRQRGTKKQRKAFHEGMKQSTGWDITHGGKLHIEQLEARVVELQNENAMLRRQLRKYNMEFNNTSQNSPTKNN